MCVCAQWEYGWSIVETTLTPGRSWPRIDVRRSLPPTLAGALVALLVLHLARAAAGADRRACSDAELPSPRGRVARLAHTRARSGRVSDSPKRRRPRRTKRAPGALRPLRRARSPGALGRRHPLPAPARDGLRTLAAAGRSPAPIKRANRVSYRRGSLTEWYANGPLGLEQGFTLNAPPAGARTGPLSLALSLSGSLQPSLGRDARSLGFAGSNLRYTGLVAFDARGHKLPARLELRGQTLLISVDDAARATPLRSTRSSSRPS